MIKAFDTQFLRLFMLITLFIMYMEHVIEEKAHLKNKSYEQIFAQK